MLIEAAPLLALFELSLILARMMGTPADAGHRRRAGASGSPARLVVGSGGALRPSCGKRRRLVQVSFPCSPLVPDRLRFLRIGSGGPGGSSTRSASEQRRIEQLAVRRPDRRGEATLAEGPEGQRRPLLTLARQRVLQGQVGGLARIRPRDSSDHRRRPHELGDAADAWSKYLKFNQGKPDPGAAVDMVHVYSLLNDATRGGEGPGMVASRPPEPALLRPPRLVPLLDRRHLGRRQGSEKAILAPKRQRSSLPSSSTRHASKR